MGGDPHLLPPPEDPAKGGRSLPRTGSVGEMLSGPSLRACAGYFEHRRRTVFPSKSWRSVWGDVAHVREKFSNGVSLNPFSEP